MFAVFRALLASCKPPLGTGLLPKKVDFFFSVKKCSPIGFSVQATGKESPLSGKSLHIYVEQYDQEEDIFYPLINSLFLSAAIVESIMFLFKRELGGSEPLSKSMPKGVPHHGVRPLDGRYLNHKEEELKLIERSIERVRNEMELLDEEKKCLDNEGNDLAFWRKFLGFQEKYLDDDKKYLDDEGKRLNYWKNRRCDLEILKHQCEVLKYQKKCIKHRNRCMEHRDKFRNYQNRLRDYNKKNPKDRKKVLDDEMKFLQDEREALKCFFRTYRALQGSVSERKRMI